MVKDICRQPNLSGAKRLILVGKVCFARIRSMLLDDLPGCGGLGTHLIAIRTQTAAEIPEHKALNTSTFTSRIDILIELRTTRFNTRNAVITNKGSIS